MIFTKTHFEGLYIIDVNLLEDDRGSFARIFCKEELAQIGFQKEIVQMNFSFNKNKGTFRGLHYQVSPFEETKLIRCTAGSVIDYALDLRKSSSTYLQIFSCQLSHKNRRMVLIPEGFAHGFITQEDNTELAYCHTAFYNKDADRGVRYDDPSINLELPFEIQNISDKDKSYPLLNIKS